MRDDVKRYEDLGVKFYIGAHVLACVLGYFLGNYVFEHIFRAKALSLFALIVLYVIHFFALHFVAGVLESVLKFFRIKLSELLSMFLSHLVLISSFLFLYSWLLRWNSETLFNLGMYALIYFTLPFGLSLLITDLVETAMGYSFSLEEKAMVQGGQSSAGASSNYKKVKADKPIVWNFADYAKQLVVGQDHAIDTIQKVLIANSKLADLGNPKRQRILASFLFVGPTGVGKTETAKALANWLKDYGYDYLRIDANQFSDRESTWTLLGSPKGYVGSDKPGLLPYAISQNPRQVILIDEIEKADQGFYQFLLQMLDEGYVIERSTGNVYYLKRAIVIIT
jgi:hypothetical protein